IARTRLSRCRYTSLLSSIALPTPLRDLPSFPTRRSSDLATLTSVLTMGIGNTVMGTVQNNVLWSLALVLLLMSLGFNMLVKFIRSEEHTSELQSRFDLVCRLLLEQKKDGEVHYERA